MFFCELSLQRDSHHSWPSFSLNLPYNHHYFSHHKVRSTPVLPGVAFLEWALKALALFDPHFNPTQIQDVVWTHPITPDSIGARLRIRLEQTSKHTVTYQLFQDKIECGSGCFFSSHAFPDPLLVPKINAHSSEKDHILHAQLYDAFEDMGITYGSFFRCVQGVQRHPGYYAEALLIPREGVELSWANLLDCAFQVGMAISIGQHRESLMPYTMGYLHFHAPIPSTPLTSAFVVTEKLSPFRTSLTIFDHTHTPLLSVCDLGVKPSHLPLVKEMYVHESTGS